MAETADSTVFGRREGSGAAQILGDYINPLKVLMTQEASKKAEEAAKATAKAERDKRFSELMDWAPDQRWDPFDRQVRDAAKNVLSFQSGAYSQGINPDDPKFRMQLRGLQDQANLVASKSNYLKGVYDEVRKTYNEGDRSNYFNTAYYDQKLNDVFMDENGNGKSILNISTEDARNVINDPAGYNIEAIARDFVDGLPEQLMETYQKKADKLGEFFDTEEFKSKIFVKDKNGKLLFDDNNNPMLKVSPEVYRAAMQDDLIKNYVNSYAQGNKEKEMEILKDILTPYDPTSYSNTPSAIYKYPTEDPSGAGYSVPEKRVDIRHENVLNAVRNLDETALQQAFRGVQGVNVRFEGGNLPGEKGKKTIIVEIKESGNDPTRPGKPKKPRLVEIPITSFEDQEAAMSQLNQLIDEGLPASQRIGPDNFSLFHKKWLENKKPLGVEFNKSTNKKSTGINWE